MAAKVTARTQRASKTRQQLFDTALELFDRKGYEKVSINEICRKAGVSTGAFYHHFKSKDQILMEEFMKIDDFYMELANKVSGIEDSLKRLQAFISSTMRSLDDMGLKRLKVTYHTQIGPDRKASYLGNEKRALYSILEGLFLEGQENGQIRQDMSAEVLTRLSIHCVRGIIYDWCLVNGSFDMIETGEMMMELFINGSLAHEQ